MKRYLLQTLIACMLAPAAATAQVYSVESLIELSRTNNQSLQAARAQALAARAGAITARAYPNPDVEFNSGPFRPTAAAAQAGTLSGTATTMGVSQRIENPRLRAARADAAAANIQSTNIGVLVTQSDVTALVKFRYFELLKRTEELEVAKEEQRLTRQIRERILVRTRSGESPRFDLFKADTEVALADKEVIRVSAQLVEAKTLLQQAVGVVLPENFQTSGDFYRKAPQADINALRINALKSNPVLRKSEADTVRATRQIEIERQLVTPSLTVRLLQDREPEMRSTRIGIALTVPLWDKREGPIAEARALQAKAKAQEQQRRFELDQALIASWQQYQASLQSVQAYEGGILTQARAVLDIAEAAYRFGERGILEYLDALRQFRNARGELINARFDLHVAAAELERLAAQDLKLEE